MHKKFSEVRYEEIKIIVADIYKSFYDENLPIDVYKLAEKLGFPVINYSSFSEEARNKLIEFDQDGFNIENNQVRIIYINDLVENEERKTTTLLHELGHCVLGHTEESDVADSEARFFAKYMGAPPVLINVMKDKSPESISRVFNISYEAAYYALLYYKKWLLFSGNIKPYEADILNVFASIMKIKGGDFICG